MIVADLGSDWRCVTQADHARLSRSVLELWRSEALPTHPRRDELLFAVGEHDNGWRESDAAPRLAPSGERPLDFTEQPAALRIDIWTRGVERYRERSAYAAALIAQHGLHLAGDDDSGDSAGLELQMRALRNELAEAAEVDLETLESDYRWLHVADLVSLVACARWSGRYDRGRTAVEREGDRIAIQPFPLAGSTTFSFACRSIPRRPYRDDPELATELATATWETARVQIVEGF